MLSSDNWNSFKMMNPDEELELVEDDELDEELRA